VASSYSIFKSENEYTFFTELVARKEGKMYTLFKRIKNKTKKINHLKAKFHLPEI